MMRTILLVLTLTATGFSTEAHPVGTPRSELLRDVEGYAIASCFINQAQPYLKDQGYAWSETIIQRGKAPLEDLAPIFDAVKLELDKGHMAVVFSENSPTKDKEAPVLYCGEIIDKSTVRAAIQKAIIKLKPYYKKK
jgi:hypothetical protein